MIERIIRRSVDNRHIIIILAVFIVAIGIYAVKHTPVDALPDLSDVQVIIKTPYPGQAPQVVEDQITYPLTTAMLSVPGATSVRGYSFFGDSYVYIIFKDGTDLYWARSRVLEYLAQVASQLPPSVHPQLGPDATGVGWIYEYALTDKSGSLDLSQLRSLQDWYLKFQLQTVPGVAEVATVGGMVKQYQVIVDPNQLRAYGLTLSKIKNAVQNANQEVGGSVIELGEAEYMVRSNGYLTSLNDIKNIPLGVNKHGTPILLTDVAHIQLGPEMRRGIADLNGQGEVVGGIIEMRQGENALRTINAVKLKLNSLRKNLPKGVTLIETYDRSGLIKRAINNLNEKLVEEFIVVTLICLLFLYHFRSALIVVITLPVGILMAFIIMHLQGINANILSLGGIAIAIGAMVDAAIVMIENVHKHIERGEVEKSGYWTLVKNAACEVGPPLFFSLLIITLSFLPVFTLQAQEGRMFKPLAFTKTYSMAAAAFLSITLVPVLMGYFIRGKITPEHKNPINRALLNLYQPMISFVFKRPKTIIIGAIVLIIVTLWPLSRIGSEFMPELNEGTLLYMPTTLPGISVGKARQLLQQTDRLIKTMPEVSTVFGKVGRADTATDPAPMSMIETVVQLKPQSQWPKGMTMSKLKKKLNQLIQFPGVTNSWGMPIKTRIDMLSTGIKTPVGIKITGPDLKVIQHIGKQLEGILNQLPDTASAYAERVVGGRYININIDRQKAARFGLNITNVEEVVRGAIGGTNVTKTVEGLERYPVNIRYPRSMRDSVEKLKLLPIVTPTGAHIPLADVATISIADGPPVIKTEDSRPSGWMYVNIKGNDIGSYVKRAKRAVARGLKLPLGYTLQWSGQYQYMERAKQRMQIVIPFTIAIIMLLLYFNFKRIGDVILIMATLPLAVVGGIWLLYLMNYNFSVAVAIGFIALAGIAVEIGVVMLVYLNQSLVKQKALAEQQQRSFAETDLRQAIIDGALLRVRPIMMTVSAIIAGLLPIMIGSGTGAVIMRSIAAPMVGGMVSATILTLMIIPAVYFLWKKRTIATVIE